MSFNRKHTKEEIENLKLASKGNKNALGYRFSDEQKLKIKGRYKGKKLPQTTKEKMSIAQKAVRLTDDIKRMVRGESRLAAFGIAPLLLDEENND